MNKAYSRIVWENYPSEATPLNEQNLNKMDAALDTIDGRVITFDTTKANQTDLLQSLKNVTYNETTGLFTFTWWNGTTKTVDLNIEKIPVSFSMSAAGVITMTNTDGTTYTADVSTLIKLYTFNTSSDIRFNTVTDASGNKTITAVIVDGSVTESKLQPNFLADCRAQVSAATAQATKAQSYAEGGTGTRTGEDTDNAKYYYEQTQAISPAYDGIAVITDSPAPLTLLQSKRGGFNLTGVGGKWEQFTTSGKNKLENGVQDGSAYGVSVVRNNDGSLTLNGTVSGNTVVIGNIQTGIYGAVQDQNDGVKHIENGEYISSNGGIQSISVQIIGTNLSSGITDLHTISGIGRFTIDDTYAYNYVRIVVSAGTYNNVTIYPMIRLATETDPTYEPYTGGAPSPSPDYPQSVNPVEITEIVEHGFNWWDEEWESGAYSYASDGSKNPSPDYIRSKNFISVIPDIEYSVTKPTGKNIRIGYYDADINYLSQTARITDQTTEFTTPTDCQFITFDVSVVSSYNHDICINISNPAKNGTYEPYHSHTARLSNPIKLYGKDDVKDEIVRVDSGEFKIHRKYGKIIFNGSETWLKNTTSSDNYLYYTRNAALINNNLVSPNAIVYSDPPMDQIGICYSLNYKVLYANLGEVIGTNTIEGFKTYLSNNPMEVYYELAEPYYEDIPVADQIALNSLETFDTVTYLDVDSEVKPTMSGEYGVSKVGGYTLAAKQHEATTDSMFTVESGMLCAIIDIA